MGGKVTHIQRKSGSKFKKGYYVIIWSGRSDPEWSGEWTQLNMRNKFYTFLLPTFERQRYEYICETYNSSEILCTCNEIYYRYKTLKEYKHTWRFHCGEPLYPNSEILVIYIIWNDKL